MTNLLPTLVDVSNKGQILIPSAMRKALGIKPKGKVILYPFKEDKQLVIEPMDKDPIEAACGMLVDGSKSLWSKELIQERLRDLKKEERDL